MRGFLLTILALLVATLAGCAGAPETEQAVTQAAKLSVAVPEWTVGQHWSYKTIGGDSGEGAITLIVTGDEGSDWRVDTNDANMAYYDDLIDVSYVGQIRKTDLAGAQGSERVKFFDFPLERNKTWTTTWDGVKQTISVQDILPNGNVHLMAHDADRMTADYEYSALAGFFDRITFFDGNGTAMYGMEHTGHGLDYPGTALRYDLQDPIIIEATALSTTQMTMSFGEANEIRLLMHAFCNGDAAGMILVGAGPKPEGETVHLPPVPMVMEPAYGIGHDCSQSQVGIRDGGLIRIEPGEQWNFDLLAGSQNGHALVVVQPRILETLAAPF